MDHETITGAAGEAIETVCRIRAVRPTVAFVSWTFTLATAMILLREDHARRSPASEWMIFKPAMTRLWPDIQSGMGRYLKTCGGEGSLTPGAGSFFDIMVPAALNVATDVRLVRQQKANDILDILRECVPAAFQGDYQSEVQLMIAAVIRLFATLGIEPRPDNQAPNILR